MLLTYSRDIYWDVSTAELFFFAGVQTSVTHHLFIQVIMAQLLNCCRERWHFKILLTLILLMLSFNSVSVQASQTIQVDVVEDTPDSTLIYDFSGSYISCCQVILDHFSDQSVENVFENHFAYSMAHQTLRTRGSFDRDAIAEGLGNTFLPVVFNASYLIVEGPEVIARIFVVIRVLDVDDSMPEFDRPHLSISFDEGRITSKSLNEAVDRDEGINSTRSYVLANTSDSEFFMLDVRMDSETQEITQVKLLNTVPFDREQQRYYSLVLIATEGNENPDSAVLNITVEVNDVCDESPTFPMSSYQPSVAENVRNVTIVTVTAMDPDSIDADNIRYTINEICSRAMLTSTCIPITEDLFVLDMETGVLTLQEELDREQFAEYEVSIHASDSCGRSATATVVISVEDENDNDPTIEHFGDRSLSEVTEANIIGLIEVSDIDEANDVTAELYDNSTGVMLSSETFTLINMASPFQLQLTQTLDRETTDHYNLVIVATDSGLPARTSVLTLDITIIDYNDNPPVLDPIPPLFTLNENQLVGTLVVDLNATDLDDVSSGNGKISYVLPPEDATYRHQNLFMIEEFTGNLLINGTLDRETDEFIRVLVEARDNSSEQSGPQMSDRVIVNISIVDLNDNTPLILSPSGTHNFAENTPPSLTPVFTVLAVDNDTEPFSTLVYSLLPQNTPFSIDSTSGVITQDSALDYEEAQSYELTIFASDGTLTGNSIVTIVVDNINDVRPVFDRSGGYFASVRENVSIGYSVVTIGAMDGDTPAGDLRFSIEAGNNAMHFEIDPVSGEITTADSLDRESIFNYTLYVRVTDGELSSESDTIVVITIIDINDHVPEFIGTPYQFQVLENKPVGYTVDTVEARDPDSGLNGEVRYEVLGVTPESATDWFRLNNTTGVITTAQLLDRETGPNEVTLNIVARDQDSSSQRFTSTVAYIVIGDQNDVAPTFSTASVTFRVSENHEIGAPFGAVQAIDSDLEPFNDTRYTVSEQPPGFTDRFDIDSRTGVLSLLRSLDYEVENRTQFVVLATDAHPPLQDRQDSITVIIDVLNARDNNLMLPLHFFPQFNLTENAAANHPIVTFEVTGLNGESVNSLEYSLVNADGTASTQFGISREVDSPEWTVHTLVSDIDREAFDGTSTEFRINVTAQDIDSTTDSYGSISVVLTIMIQDENDNIPRLSEEVYSFTIVENNALNAVVDSVLASDPDYKQNGTIRYSMEGLTVPFSIDEVSGEIMATEQLDPDSVANPSLYTFTVVARDQGTPVLSSSSTVQVHVLDLNDNYPVFDTAQNRTFFASEGLPVASIIGRLRVSDADSGANGQVSVSVAPASRSVTDAHFRIDPNGTIVLTSPLDRETEDFFSFVARAQDGGSPPKTATATVNINVVDANDHAPMFEMASYSIQIAEDQMPDVVLRTVTANDDDIGSNAEVRYALGDYSLEMTFNLNPVSGEITLHEPQPDCIEVIDFERQNEYNFEVLAYDFGVPRHIVSTNVRVTVTNVNEHPPQFDRDLLIVFVDENQQVATEVLQISAFDLDNDHLMYTVLENGQPSSNFRYQDGGIVTNRVLDYNSEAMYVLTLRATELSGDLNGTVVVEVYVNNINDHPPVWDTTIFDTATTIKESTPMGTVVLTVYASDEDDVAHDAVSYSISAGNEQGMFAIDSLTGELYVNAPLDFEVSSSYLLTMIADDSGSPTFTSSPLDISITIININEDPVFNEPQYSFQISENMGQNSVVGTVSAPDGDEGSFGIVKYSLTEGANSYFDVDPTSGAVRLLPQSGIDRETLTSNPITFSVTASDQGRPPNTATVQVNVTVVDENDNTPQFSASIYIFPIGPDQSSDVIGSVSASDPDEGLNGEFSYEIIGSVDLSLDVLPTGQLTLQQPIPNNYQPIYEFTVRVVDSQANSRYEDALVQLLIETATDHHPRFSAQSLQVSVFENTPVDESVYDVSDEVTDEDTGPNGELSFAFGDSYPEFNIGQTTGVITLREVLDFEQQQRYELVIHASDNTAIQPRTATATLVVSVVGINDFDPEFIDLPSSITFSPVPFSGVKLFAVIASDGDVGVGASVGYSIMTAGQFLVIDSQTGVVTNEAPLTNNQAFEVNVSAFDDGSPVGRAHSVVQVSIEDPGSMAPSFLAVSSPHTLMIPETHVVGDALQATFATNPEADSYHIVHHNGSEGMFEISVEGQLTLESELDFEEETNYRLIIEARITSDENPTIRYSSFLEVFLVVVDMNDNTPQFVPMSAPTVREDSDVDVSLFQVTAIDGDRGSFADIAYRILADGNFGLDFQIDEHSGIVSLANSLDREVRDEYELTIRATDSGTQINTAEMTILVEISDVVDYAPRFARPNYTIGVFEHPLTMEGDRIIKLAAKDLDKDPQLLYLSHLVEARHLGSLVEGVSPGAFLIDPDTGLITLGSNTILDRETIDYYLLEVSVSDHMFTTTTFLEIRVMDANDNSPHLSVPSNHIEVWEQQPSGTLVTDAVVATDSDTGKNGWVQYFLDDDWPDSFVIDPYSGVIRVATPIVFSRSLRLFTATVLAVDQGASPRTSSATIEVTVVDVNDHAPEFEQDSFEIPISVDTLRASRIFRFNVTDMDERENNHAVITIPSYYAEANSLFSIDGSDMILDMDQSQGLHVGNYSFRVQSTNLRFCPPCAEYVQAAYADVTVVVNPVNTGCPVFSSSDYSTSVDEDHIITIPLPFEISATDPDGDLFQFFLTDENLPFSVVGGRVYLTESLDWESETAYSFEIQAVDEGFPQLTCTALVNINVNDVNDNAPAFEQTAYHTNIGVNTEPERSVSRIGATDPDSGSGGTVRYRLELSDVPFRVDAQSGELFTTSSILNDSRTFHSFEVIAYDGGIPMLQSSITVSVQVIVFPQTTYEFTVNQNTRRGELVGSVQIVDPSRISDGSELIYVFTTTQPTRYFRLDNNTGNIYLIVDPVASTTDGSSQSIVKRDTTLPPGFFLLSAQVRVTGDAFSDTADVNFVVHESFEFVQGAADFPVIIAIVVAAVIGVVFVFVIITIIALVLRSKHRTQKAKINDVPMNNDFEMAQSRYSSRRSNGSYVGQFRQTNAAYPPEHNTINHSVSGSGSNSSRHSYTADDEMDSLNGRMPYPSPSLARKSPAHRSPHVRSTSDLASTVCTEHLHTSQDAHPYPKAQIEAIYAANAHLLTSPGSQDSIHMFGSEGGGEADGDIDIDQMLFTKYDLAEDDDDDDSTIPDEAKSMNSSTGNIDVPPVEEREAPYTSYKQNMKGWGPRTGSMTEAIDVLHSTANYPPEEPMPRRSSYTANASFLPSQNTSVYGESSSQGSRSSLVNHQHRHFDGKQMHMAPPPHDYHYYDHSEGRHSSHGRMRSQRYGSANALPHEDYAPPRVDMHYSQEMVPSYLHSHPQPYYMSGRAHSPVSSTPTDGTVTPHRALTSDFDEHAYLTSSSTSVGSTNLSHDQDDGMGHNQNIYR